jgi:molybdate transport system substrate-binding protein
MINSWPCAFLVSIGLVALLTGLLSTGPDEPLLIYCAASSRAPVEAIVAEYQREFQIRLHVQFGASGTMLAGAKTSGQGDLFLPADDYTMELARRQDLVADVFPFAIMRPVLAVHRDNPQRIQGLADLRRDGVRLAQANPDAAAIGRLTREILSRTGQWDDLKHSTAVFKLTVNDVANDIQLGAVHAGFVWDVTLHQYPRIKEIPAAELAGVQSQVAIAVLKSSRQPEAARHFARYLLARDKGLKHFEEYGFCILDTPRQEAKP